MSRHVLDHEKVTVVYGWDNPMRTYFAQVYYKDRPVDEMESPHERIGYEYGEVDSAEELLDWINSKLGEGWIPGIATAEDFVQVLEFDRHESAPRTEHQKGVERLVTGKEPPDA